MYILRWKINDPNCLLNFHQKVTICVTGLSENRSVIIEKIEFFKFDTVQLLED